MSLIRKASFSVSIDNGVLVAIKMTPLLYWEGTCLFNPSEFSITREVTYAEHRIPGLGRPITQFISGGAEILQMSLLFDTYSPGILSLMVNPLAIASAILPETLKLDVRKLTEPIVKLAEVVDDIHAPPIVDFSWGSTLFTGYIISCSEKFTMFSHLGTPVRSVLNITMRSTVQDKAVRNSPDRTKHRTITEGDRLFMHAYNEYSSVGEWRAIADANGIDNPRLLKSGSHIVIPPI